MNLRGPVVERTEIVTVQQTPIARGDLAVSLAPEPRGKQCIIRLQSFLLSGSLTPDRMASVLVSPGRIHYAYGNMHATGREQSSRYNGAGGCCMPSFCPPPLPHRTRF